jgi:hypothetical protein
MERFVPYLICKPKNLESESNPFFSIQNKNDISVSSEIPDDLTENEMNSLIEFLTDKIIIYLKNKYGVSIENNYKKNEWLSFTISKNNKTIEKTLLLANFYQFNSWVKIKANIYDQYIKIPISHFKGKIIDFYNDGEKDVFYIVWCSESLQQIPEPVLKKCFRRKISPLGTYIQSDMIFPISFHENSSDLSVSQMNLLKPYLLEKFEGEYKTVFSVFENTSVINSEEIWEKFFENEIQNNKEISLYKGKQNCKLISISGSDEKNGVWVEIEIYSKRYISPLNEFSSIVSQNNLKRNFENYLI